MGKAITLPVCPDPQKNRNTRLPGREVNFTQKVRVRLKMKIKLKLNMELNDKKNSMPDSQVERLIFHWKTRLSGGERSFHAVKQPDRFSFENITQHQK